CPPNSIVTCLIVSALFLINVFPTGVEPVNVILRMYSLSVNKSPTPLPRPLTHLIAPGGIPASYASSTILIAVKGVSTAGFTINVQPAARAGAAFLVIIAAGKFHGVIAATSPIG